jgi:AcrR family transcriptional regulator
MTSTAPGRREERKRETRTALFASAVKLFAERGYQATTVADIAAGAGVAARTFFGYFPTKEAVLFLPVDELAANLEEVLATGPDDALTTLRAWVYEHADWFRSDFRELRDLIEASSEESHTVAVTGLLFINRISAAVASRLRRDLDAEPDDAMPDIAAAATVAALTAALPMGHFGCAGEPAADRSGRLLDDLDAAIRFARAGLVAARTGQP